MLVGRPFRGFRPNADGVSAKRHGRSGRTEVSEHQALGLSHVGDGCVLRGYAAAGQAGKGQRGGHQFQEIATVNRIVPTRKPAGENSRCNSCFESRSSASSSKVRQYCLPVLDFSLARTAARSERMHLRWVVIQAIRGVLHRHPHDHAHGASSC